MSQADSNIADYYGRRDLAARLLRAFCQAGLDPENLTRDDLIGFDEFHVGGRKATRALAALAELKEGETVLDLGCGIGGPARTLAVEFGGRVTGLDLTHAFIGIAEMLTSRLGLKEKLTFYQGSATETPFADSSFDVIWMQHLSMNIIDKLRLFAETKRLLKPGGRLAFHEAVAGELGEPHYPVFWAADSSLSHLIPPEQLRELLTGVGYTISEWHDTTQTGIDFFERALNSAERKGPRPLGISVLVGEDAPLKSANLLRNLQEGRLRLVQAVAG